MTPRGDEPQVRPADTDTLIKEGIRLADLVGSRHSYDGKPLGPILRDLADALAREREAREKAELDYRVATYGWGSHWPDLDDSVDALRARVAYLGKRFEGHQEVIHGLQAEAMDYLGRIRNLARRAWGYRQRAERAEAQLREIADAWLTMGERGTEAVRSDDWYALRERTREALASSPPQEQKP